MRIQSAIKLNKTITLNYYNFIRPKKAYNYKLNVDPNHEQSQLDSFWTDLQITFFPVYLNL